MTESEKRLCDWQYHRSGSFFTALFYLMCKADTENMARLLIAFPEEGSALIKFKTDENYWPTLEAEYLK